MVTCVHHWILGDPVGLETPGECKHCGAERTFTGGLPSMQADWKNVPFISGATPLVRYYHRDRTVLAEEV